MRGPCSIIHRVRRIKNVYFWWVERGTRQVPTTPYQAMPSVTFRPTTWTRMSSGQCRDFHCSSRTLFRSLGRPLLSISISHPPFNLAFRRPEVILSWGSSHRYPVKLEPAFWFSNEDYCAAFLNHHTPMIQTPAIPASLTSSSVRQANSTPTLPFVIAALRSQRARLLAAAHLVIAHLHAHLKSRIQNVRTVLTHPTDCTTIEIFSPYS